MAINLRECTLPLTYAENQQVWAICIYYKLKWSQYAALRHSNINQLIPSQTRGGQSKPLVFYQVNTFLTNPNNPCELHKIFSFFKSIFGSNKSKAELRSKSTTKLTLPSIEVRTHPSFICRIAVKVDLFFLKPILMKLILMLFFLNSVLMKNLVSIEITLHLIIQYPFKYFTDR